MDGEGCFFAQFYPTEAGTLPLTLRAEITLRADDRDILRTIRAAAGGKIADRPARSTLWMPTATWRVSGRRECERFLGAYGHLPLRSKKARDFKTWKEIVETYAKFKRGGRGARLANAPHISRIETLITQLKEGRNYQ